MTGPQLPPGVQTIVTRLSGGDRSTALALHAVIITAGDKGETDLNRVAICYRDDYLADLRAAGWDAEREAGRLSLDEVRRHLTWSVLPRMVAEAIIALPGGTLESPDAPIVGNPTLWAEIRQARLEIADVIRQTGEHPTPRTPAPAVPAVTGAPAAAAATSAPSGSVLEAKGLVKIYRRRRVVNDVALRLQQGEIVGLLGPNGAGKTTTFYMIVGLIQPLGGRIVLDGRDITTMPMYRRARQGIGYLSQEPSIFRKLTVEENILAILETLPLSGAERRSRLEKLLDELSIKHLRRSKAYALSGGERRRLEITRALVSEPKFMLLDEPFAGVDPIAVHDIQTIVAGLRHRGIGVLITDHNVEQTLDIVDRAYIMFEGKVQASGSVRDLVYDDRVAQLYLGPTLTARLRARLEAVA